MLIEFYELTMSALELCEHFGRSLLQKLKLDDHSEADPLLPIPNRTVKHLSADDSAGSRAKVGHRQAH